MTVLEVIQRSAEFLARKGVDSPRLQVELLLAHTLHLPRLRLYLDFERQLTEPELGIIRSLVKRRGNREPLQHLVGSTSFCGLEIRVNAQVLIPRPETEMLAERAWQFLKTRTGPGSGPVTALDFGTGSGCLALALAREVPAVELWALDISSAALAVARDNAGRLRLAERIRFVEGDGFAVLSAGQRFDLIVSNPPYIASVELETLAPEVRDHDPRLALDGGTDGLDFYRRLSAEAGRFLKPSGCLMCEFGDGQAEPIASLFRGHGWAVDSVVPDLSGRARILVARRAES